MDIAIRTEEHFYGTPMKAAEGVLFLPRVIIREQEGFEHRGTEADLFFPENPGEGLSPAIVFLHGGSWRFGSPRQFYFQAIELVKRLKFAALCVDYTKSAEARFPEAVVDAKCAIQWLRMNKNSYSIDPVRIAVCGGSSGANIAAMAATTANSRDYTIPAVYAGISSGCNAAILFNGEYDMWDLVERGSLLEAMAAYLGGSPEDVPDRYSENSPLKNIDAGAPPALLLHGMEDSCVSYKQSLTYYQRLLDYGVTAKLLTYPGKDHAWFNNEPDRSITLREVENFLALVFQLG